MSSIDKFEVEVRYDDDIKGLIHMPKFSEWFTRHQINPVKGEHLFVPEDDKNFPLESEWSKSTEWVIVEKFYDPVFNKIIIWCKCALAK